MKKLILWFIYYLTYIWTSFAASWDVINNITVQNSNWFDKQILSEEFIKQFYIFQLSITIIVLIVVFVIKLLHIPKNTFWSTVFNNYKIFWIWKK